MLNTFILYGRGAGSKGIPMSKQQQREHESEVLESGNRWMKETGFMLWQPYFIKKITPRILQKEHVTKAIFNIKWRGKFPTTLPGIKQWLSSQHVWLL